MRRVVVFVVLGLFMSVSPVMAQAHSDAEEQLFNGAESAAVEVLDNADVPDPTQPLFGIRVALMRVSQSIQLWTAGSEERKAEFEIVFAEREHRLIEKIEAVEDEALRDRLEENLIKIQERYNDRIESIEERLSEMEEGEGVIVKTEIRKRLQNLPNRY